MDHSNTLRRCALAVAAAAAFGAFGTASAQSGGAVDLGTAVPDAQAVKEGLFPEDACKELEAAGFKCMGFKPAMRYSLPATAFAVGSADVPEGLKKQLDVFADVLRGKKGGGRQVRVIGHADASGSPDANQSLSLRRAESVKSYLVSKGADAAMLVAVGVGASEPKNAADPKSAENRRVEIAREQPPKQ